MNYFPIGIIPVPQVLLSRPLSHTAVHTPMAVRALGLSWATAYLTLGSLAKWGQTSGFWLQADCQKYTYTEIHRDKHFSKQHNFPIHSILQLHRALAYLSHYLESLVAPTFHLPGQPLVDLLLNSVKLQPRLRLHLQESLFQSSEEEDEGEDIPGHQGPTGFAAAQVWAALRVCCCRILWATSQFYLHFLIKHWLSPPLVR